MSGDEGNRHCRTHMRIKDNWRKLNVLGSLMDHEEDLMNVECH